MKHSNQSHPIRKYRKEKYRNLNGLPVPTQSGVDTASLEVDGDSRVALGHKSASNIQSQTRSKLKKLIKAQRMIASAHKLTPNYFCISRVLIYSQERRY